MFLESMAIDIKAETSGSENVSDLEKRISAITKAADRYGESIERHLRLVKNQIESSGVQGKQLEDLEKNYQSLGSATDSMLDTGIILAATLPAIGAKVLKLTGGFAGLKDTITKVRPGFLGVFEAVTLLGPSLLYLGDQVEQSDNRFVQFAGTLTKSVGLAFVSVTAGLNLLAFGLGSVIEGLGDKLIAFSANTEMAATKADRSLNQFKFTLEGFASVYGDSVGTFDQWIDKINELQEASTRSSEEFLKASKLLVSESSVLGLGFEENTKLLEVATNLAAKEGRRIDDVTGSIVSGLLGVTQSLRLMGIDLTSTGIELSKFGSELDQNFEKMGTQEQIMTRYNVLLEKTKPIVGAMAAETETLAGMFDRLSIAQQQFNEKLGQSSFFTRSFVEISTALLTIPLPNFLYSVAGALTDFLGVTLKVIGAVLKYTFVITGSIAVLNLLNKVLASTTVATNLMAAAYARLGIATTAAMAPITSVAALLKGIAILAKGLAIKALAAAFAALTAPITLVVGALATLYYGIQQVSDELDLNLFKTVKDAINEIGLFESAWQGLTDIFQKSVATIQITVKALGLLAVGIGLAIQKLNILRRDFFAADSEKAQIRIDLEKVDQDIETVQKAFKNLAPSDKIEINFPSISGLSGETQDFLDTLPDSIARLQEEISSFAANDLEKSLNSISLQKDKINLVRRELMATNRLTEARRDQLLELERLLNSKSSQIVDQTFEEIAKRTRDINLSLEEDQVSAIQQRLALQNQEIAQLEAMLVTNKQLTFERKKQLDELRQALDLQASREIEQVKIEQSGQIGSSLDAISSTFSNLGLDSVASSIQSAASSAAASYLAMADMAIQAVNALIDFFPRIISDLAGVFEGLTNLPANLSASLKGLFESITDFISNFIPEILENVFNIIFDTLMHLVEGLPNALVNLLTEVLPNTLLSIIDRIPELAERFVTGLISATPKIVGAFINWSIKGIPKIVEALIKSAPKIAAALVVGIVEGIRQAISGIFSGNFSTKDLEDSINKAGDQISEKASQIFSIEDLDESVGFTDFFNQITDDMQATWLDINKMWQDFLNGLMGVWSFFETTWRQFVDDLGVAWGDLEKIWKDFMVELQKAWNNLEKVWRNIWDQAEKNWRTLVKDLQSVYDRISKFFQNVGSDIYEGLKKAFQRGFKFFEDLGKKIAQGFLDGIGSLGGAFSGIKIPSFKDLFSVGGYVSGPAGAGDISNALLSPGEFVIRREAVNSFGVENLAFINRTGRTPQAGGGVSIQTGDISIEIVSNGDIDEDFVRDQLTPTLLDEIKTRSQDGEYIIDAKGVR